MGERGGGGQFEHMRAERERKESPWKASLDNWMNDIQPEAGFELAVEKMIREYKITEDFFSEPSRTEVLFAIVASMQEAEGSAESEQDSAFLRRFVQTLTKEVPPNETETMKDLALRDRVVADTDPDLTARMEALVASDCEQLRSIRERLNIRLDAQTPFQLIVTTADNKRGYNSAEKRLLPSPWALLVNGEEGGNVPEAFVLQISETEQYLVVSKDIGNAVLGIRSDSSGYYSKYLVHEYVHTQRTLQPAPKLGFIFEEVLAGESAKDSTHFSSRVLISQLSHELTALGKTSLWDAVFESAKRNDKGAHLYRTWTKTFGPRALIDALATRPTSYDPAESVGEIPGVQHDPVERMGDLFSRILERGKERMPGFGEDFIRRLQTKTAEQLQTTLDAWKYHKIRIPDAWKDAIQKRITEKPA